MTEAEVADALARIRALPPSWDVHNSARPSPAAIDLAEKVCTLMPPRYVAPMADGGVGIGFGARDEADDVHVAIENEGGAAVMRFGTDGAREFLPAPYDAARIVELLRGAPPRADDARDELPATGADQSA